MSTAADSRRIRGRRGNFGIRLILGVAVLLAGVVLILDELGMVDAEDYFALWPLGLIAIGLTKLPSQRTTDLLFAGIFVGVGAWALAHNLGWIHEVPWDYLWPLALVLIGAHLLLGGFRRRRAPAGSEDFVAAFAMLGGAERKCASRRFAGADLTAIMGGCDLDLRQAGIEPGAQPVIQVFALWGGITLRLPHDWKVDFGLLPILGGYSDDTEQNERADSPTVRIQGVAIMGGIDVKN